LVLKSTIFEVDVPGMGMLLFDMMAHAVVENIVEMETSKVRMKLSWACSDYSRYIQIHLSVKTCRVLLSSGPEPMD
jgi:hypothetical protein